MDDFGKQTQGEKEAIIDKALAQLKQEEANALKNKLVIVKVSELRYIVVQLTHTDYAAGDVFRGRIVHGKATLSTSKAFICDVLNGVEVIEP